MSHETKTITVHAAYLNDLFKRSTDICDEACKRLANVEFDTFIGTGISGALIVPLLSFAMSKRFAIVRKPNDGSHSWCRIEGTVGSRWIFVDDFIEGGSTFRRVYTAVEELTRAHVHPCDFAGTFLYHRLFELDQSRVGQVMRGFMPAETLRAENKNLFEP